MGYFDDFQLLNVIQRRMYGTGEIHPVITDCNYMGVISGEVLISGRSETRPLVYFTPKDLSALSGWQSSPGALRDNFYIECRGSRADRLFAAFDASDKVQLYFVASPLPYIELLTEIQQLFIQGNPLNGSKIVLLVEEFAALLENEINGEKNNGKSGNHIRTLLTAINRDPGRSWDFSAEAEKTEITLRHFNRRFHAAAGMPPYRFVNFCRLRLARQLLSESSLRIKEIAEKCGFENASEFSRFFRKNTGISPAEYRQSRLL